VEPVIDLGPGAERNPLARRLAELVQNSVRHERQRRHFEALSGSAAVVTDDASQALTLRFDFGRLTVHEGVVGIPDVTLRGDAADIERLSDLPFRTPFELPLPRLRDRAERRALALVLAAVGGRKIKIYGLLLHARFVLGLLRVLSQRG
jgi:hypothetical protein